MKWLMDRFNGRKFVDCTGFSDVINGEKNIEKFKNKLKHF